MKRILNSKITFIDPYVIRTELQNSQRGITEGLHFFTVLQRAKKIYTGATWAYSNPEDETIYLSPPSDGLKKLQGLASVFGGGQIYSPDIKVVTTAYWAFKDEQDALQFRLVFGEYATRVHMWDKRITFTVIEQDE